jgi:GT2 family glycosyltransferase
VSVAVVVLTCNRLPLLRRCVENVIARTTRATTEILIWDNGSGDGTDTYLGGLADPRLRVVRTPANVGMVAYGRAFAMTSAPYIVQLDDDVVDAPPGWDATLLETYQRLPMLGYLAADVVDDPLDRLSHERHRVHHYEEILVNGVRLLDGPTGGWCTITSRRIYDEVGGLPKRSRQTYFSTDTIYVHKVQKAGYGIAILPSLVVRHEGDRLGAPRSSAKAAFFEREERIDRWKDRVKSVLLTVPGMREANRRNQWFREPGVRD